MKLAWNAIVKNEASIIERCVSSLLPHVDCGIVVDTGSTDGTPELIKQLFITAGKPLELHHAPFANFEVTRNLALLHARTSSLDWDYLLLADADMELRVSDPHWINGHAGLAYNMRQAGGALGYYNRRLVSRKAEGWYMGVTHEYLDIPSSGNIVGADFIDHADGANRPNKSARDIEMLEQALATETRPGLIERYTFYLANSYFEQHDWSRASELYKKRVTLAGYAEECWYAQMRYAKCLSHLGDEPNFLREMLRAYQMRPSRAEVLYELARYFRERKENATSLLFSEMGLSVPYPTGDLLFVNDWIYKTGLKEEFSICGYYSERHRRTAAKEANRLALAGSEQAKSNLYWYLQPLAESVPSFRPQQIAFTPPDGYVAMNPSVINHNGQPVTLVRTVNYTINADGGYDIRDGDGSTSYRNSIHTRNFLVHPETAVELQLPGGWPPPEFNQVRGFEDSRLFEWQGELWTLSTVRERTREGWCEQIMTPIVPHGYGDRWNLILPFESEERRHEKNWMPWVEDGNLRFVYRLGVLIDIDGTVVAAHDVGMDIKHISGGSPVVTIDDSTHLALVHEARTIPGRLNRYYQHRFVNFRSDGRVGCISAPFFFHDRQIEFAAGLAYFPEKNQLMASYGVRDYEAWTAIMDADEVVRFIYKDAPWQT